MRPQAAVSVTAVEKGDKVSMLYVRVGAAHADARLQVLPCMAGAQAPNPATQSR